MNTNLLIPNGLNVPSSESRVMTQLGHGTVVGQNGRACIWFFRPRKIGPHGRRSTLYKFDANVQEAVYSGMSEMLRKDVQGIPSNSYNDSFLYDYDAVVGAILPSSDAIALNTSIMDEQFTFMMFVDNDFRNNTGVSPMAAGAGHRMLYAGYCVGEPYSNLNGNINTNPNCMLVITHHSVVHMTREFSAGTGQVVKDSVIRDIDLVNPAMAPLASADPDLYMLTPSAVRKSTAVNDIAVPSELGLGGAFQSNMPFGNTVQTQPGGASLANAGQLSVPVETTLASPRHHMQRIVNEMHNSLLNHVDGGSSAMGLIAGTDLIGSEFTSHLAARDAVINTMIGPINFREPVRLADLYSHYPNLEIASYDVGDFERNIINPMEMSRTNVVSSLLTSVIPAVMANHTGLAHVTFTYNSWMNDDNGNPGRFELQHIGTFVPVAQEMLKLKFRHFCNELRRSVWPLVHNLGGHFQVSVSSSCAQETIVNLNYLDQVNSVNDGLFINNSMLGGLSSSLVGNFNSLNNNVVNLQTVVNNLTSTTSDYPGTMI